MEKPRAQEKLKKIDRFGMRIVDMGKEGEGIAYYRTRRGEINSMGMKKWRGLVEKNTDPKAEIEMDDVLLGGGGVFWVESLGMGPFFKALTLAITDPNFKPQEGELFYSYVGEDRKLSLTSQEFAEGRPEYNLRLVSCIAAEVINGPVPTFRFALKPGERAYLLFRPKR